MKTYGQYIRKENGVPELQAFEYLRFYEAHIHPYEEFLIDDKSQRLYQGITAAEFLHSHREGFLDLVRPILDDARLARLQEELEAEGKQVCMFNLFILALFLVERGKSRYVILLKPTIRETVEALDHVTKITFTNRDGSTVESNSGKLLQMVLETLEAQKESDAGDYEVERVTTWDEFTNNSVLQSYFVHDLTLFLHRYFPVKRKKDAQISTKEVELVMYLLKLFGLAKEEPTNKRYWQLMKLHEKTDHPVTDIGRFNLGGEERLIPMHLIPYRLWSKGKIDWTDTPPGVEIKEGSTIRF